MEVILNNQLIWGDCGQYQVNNSQEKTCLVHTAIFIEGSFLLPLLVPKTPQFIHEDGQFLSNIYI